MTAKKEGAVRGRPRKYESGSKHVNIYLPADKVDKFKALGGSVWIVKKMEEEECRHSQK